VDMVTNNGRITGFHIEKGIMVAEFENNTRHCDLMLLIKAPKEEQVQPHKCKYCGIMVTSDSDEGCYANPNKPVDNIGSAGKTFTAPESLSQHPMCKTEEQVPIKVEIMEFGYGKPQENKGKFYVANFNLPNNAKLPTEKYQSIKSAIEDVLNGKTEYGLLVATGNIESYNKGYSMGYKDANKYNDKKYTESELLQARRDAFYAGRSFDCWNVSSHQYAKFEDYINSLK